MALEVVHMADSHTSQLPAALGFFSPITGIPIKFVSHLKNVHVKEKGKARLECEMSSKDVHIKWLKDGKDISNNPRYSFMREGKRAEIVIDDCDLADSGEYTIVCTQDNDAQEYVSSANLTVDGMKINRFTVNESYFNSTYLLVLPKICNLQLK